MSRLYELSLLALLCASPALLATSFSVSPQALTLQYVQGTLPSASLTQTFTVLSGTDSQAFTVTSSAAWLVAPSAGTTGSSYTVSANPVQLVPGAYRATLSFSLQSTLVQVPVELTVTPPPSLTALPAAVGLLGTYGTIALTTQSVQLTSANANVVFTASGNVPWLSFTASGLSTPATLQISANPSGLAPATYQGAITVTAISAGDSPYAIPVRLVVGGTGAASSAIDNSASYDSGTAAPNTILTLFGPALGCTQNPQVLINGSPTAILFSNTTQINFVVPDGAGGTGTMTTVQAACSGNPVETVTIPSASTDPAIFTGTATGTGQGSIVNADGTLNAAGNPASRGSYISVYVTGFGPLNNAGADGLQHLTYPVTATIGGVGASVLYAGQAPSETSGLQQINLQVPAGTPTGSNVPLSLTANGFGAQAGVTVSIQ